MKVHVGWNISNLTAVNGDLVSQHAGSWNLDRVGPVVVVEAQGIGEVENCILRDHR